VSAGKAAIQTKAAACPEIEKIRPDWKEPIETDSEEMPSRRVEKWQTARIDFVKITDSILKPDLLLYSVERARTATDAPENYPTVGIFVGTLLQLSAH
jgi:hypothetical protein